MKHLHIHNLLKTGLLFAFAIGLFSCNNQSDQADAYGTFEATEVLISSEASGKLIAFEIVEGENLQNNQLVGAVDSTQLYLKKQQIIAQIAAIESRKPEITKQLAVLEQQVETLEIEKKRVENLLAVKAAKPKQLDDIQGQMAYLQKQIVALRSTLQIQTNGIYSDVATLYVQLEQVDDQLEKCAIVNPMDGTVLGKYAEQYELASPGKPLYKIANLKDMILRAYVTSDQLTRIAIGNQVKVFTDNSEHNEGYVGTVTWISDQSEFTPKTIQTKDERANSVYAVKIAVPNDGSLKIGMYGSVKFDEL